MWPIEHAATMSSHLLAQTLSVSTQCGEAIVLVEADVFAKVSESGLESSRMQS